MQDFYEIASLFPKYCYVIEKYSEMYRYDTVKDCQMGSKVNDLLVPVYINEKIVLDMLAIMDDGFSVVSQVGYQSQQVETNEKNGAISIATPSSILGKLLKIDASGNIASASNSTNSTEEKKEKIHTNVSLFSKFRAYLIHEGLFKRSIDFNSIQVGDFIEAEGELEKNPLISYLDTFADVMHLADIFSDEPKEKNRKEENRVETQIRQFSGELKHSGTIDFIMTGNKGTVVLSVQERYLENDNISEILGGSFKILGKVIAVCNKDGDSINLLRKTSLTIMPEAVIEEMFSEFKKEELSTLNLPQLITKIPAPAMIVIPIAIYA